MDFWTSWQVHKHLIELAKRVEEAEKPEDPHRCWTLHHEMLAALDFVLRKLAAYGHVTMSEAGDATTHPDNAAIEQKTIAQLKTEREGLLQVARDRWAPNGADVVSFQRIYSAAKVYKKSANLWRRGQLKPKSVMSKRIEAVLKKPEPPPRPQSAAERYRTPDRVGPRQWGDSPVKSSKFE